jgi:hypothetical protein
VQEVKVEPVNLAQCLAVRVELGLEPAPVVAARPVTEHVDDVAARRSLRPVGRAVGSRHGLVLGQPRTAQAVPEIVQSLVRDA